MSHSDASKPLRSALGALKDLGTSRDASRQRSAASSPTEKASMDLAGTALSSSAAVAAPAHRIAENTPISSWIEAAELKTQSQSLLADSQESRLDNSGYAPVRQKTSSRPPLDVIGMLLGHPLTSEQETVWNSNASRLKVRAYAGSGKTSLLVAIAHQSSERGIYVAFNKSIALEAQGRFPTYIECKTSHSIALGSLMKQDSRWRDSFKSKIGVCTLAHATAALAPLLSHAESRGALARIALDTVELFILSADDVISESHLPVMSLHLLRAQHQFIDIPLVLKLAQHLWRGMANPADLTLPIGHDGYLKKWSLSSTPISTGLLLLDEAQDSNPALLKALARSGGRHVYVGDEHQAIYGFRGAQNALDQIQGDAFSLTQSFRFGPAIAQLASSIILLKKGNEPLKGLGRETVIQRGSPPLGARSLYLARTNTGLFERALRDAKAGRSLYFVGGGGVSITGIPDLLSINNGEKPQDPYLQGFTSLTTLQEEAVNCKDMELALKCSLVMEYGKDLLGAMSTIKARTVDDPSKAKVFLSTVHKSKGMEFDWVELGDDFIFPEFRQTKSQWLEEADYEEANILYVAITRAKLGLVLSSDGQWRWFERMKKLLSTPFLAAAPRDLQSAAEAFILKEMTGRGLSSGTTRRL